MADNVENAESDEEEKEKLPEYDLFAPYQHPDVDYKDMSAHPSFTNFQIPYEVQCKARYVERGRMYNQQFMKELKKLEIFQQSAYEAARFNRHLGITTLWPPLHNRREISYFLQQFFVHSPKDKKRLRYLLDQTQD